MASHGLWFGEGRMAKDGNDMQMKPVCESCVLWFPEHGLVTLPRRKITCFSNQTPATHYILLYQSMVRMNDPIHLSTNEQKRSERR